MILCEMCRKNPGLPHAPVTRMAHDPTWWRPFCANCSSIVYAQSSGWIYQVDMDGILAYARSVPRCVNAEDIRMLEATISAFREEDQV